MTRIKPMDLTGKRLLVIGGGGLMGSHTVDALLAEPVAEIRIYDNFTRGRRENLAAALRDERVTIFPYGGDILHRDILRRALDGIDGVFHFAALWLLHCQEFPRSAFEVNVAGTFNVIEACLDAGVQRLVYSSSASVYGDAVSEPMTEEHPYNNTNFYGATKIAGEHLARSMFHRARGLGQAFEYVGLRYMNVYGPRQDYQGAYISVIMKVLDRLDAGLPPLVYGDGSQAYDFVYVGDCATANVCAMKAGTTDEFYNVGTGVRTSIRELTELILDVTGSGQQIEFHPGGTTFVKNRVGCPRKAARELGFQARVKLRDGIARLIEWRAAHKDQVAERRREGAAANETRVAERRVAGAERSGAPAVSSTPHPHTQYLRPEADLGLPRASVPTTPPAGASQSLSPSHPRSHSSGASQSLSPSHPPEIREPIAIARPALGEEEWLALRAPIESGWLTQGPQVAAFERAFAARHGVEYAIATTSCTTALHLALAALEIGPGDEVIVPAFTWVATANVAVYCGATPVFVDIDPATYNIDPARVAAAITPRTRAIVAVHLFGLCADMDALRTIAGGIPIVEDAACAAGAAYRGRPAGSLGTMGCFSFHPRKTITTGEGGMLTTRDPALAERLSRLRNHGASVSEEERHGGPQPWRLPEFNVLGYNYRMTDLQGTVGLVQLGKLDAFIAERRRAADFYRRSLADLEWLHLPAEPDGDTHGWQAFVCRVDEDAAPCSRNELMERLNAERIGTRPGTHSVPHLGWYRERFGCDAASFPNALDAAATTLALPLHNRMTEDEYRYVVHVLHRLDQEQRTQGAQSHGRIAA